jgi:hypothetical protein
MAGPRLDEFDRLVMTVPQKRPKSGKTPLQRHENGAPWLKPNPIQCARRASRAKSGYLQAHYPRPRSRRRSKKAACAVAASILVAARRMLNNATLHQGLGASCSGNRAKDKHATRLVSR